MSYKKIIYQNALIIDQEQWFWSENYNALFKRNLEQNTICRMSAFEKGKTAAYTKLVFYNNKLIALPYAADQIMIYDLKNNEIRYSDIGISEINDDNNAEKFFGLVAKDNWLFMIGCKTAHVLKFDMEAELTSGYVNLHTELAVKNNGIGYFRDAIVSEKQIIVPALYENFVFEINIDDMSYSKKQIDKNGFGFSTLFKDQDEIWFLPFDEGEIVRWNKEKNKIQRFFIDNLFSYKKGARNFLSVQKFNDKLWIIPRYGNRLLSYDLVTKQFSNKNAVNQYFDCRNREVFGTAAEKNGQDIIFLPEQIDEILLFCPEKDEIKVVHNEIPGDDYLEFLNNRGEKIVTFEHDIQLSDYLEFICKI